jgi:molybdenum-dependent DNA-binding transcriptional regulator ModE
MEQNAGVQFIVARHGGTARGGTELTPEGRKLRRDYRRFQKELYTTVRKRSRFLFSY